jgi:hypothetical protein
MNNIKEKNAGAQGAPDQDQLPVRILINENLLYFDGIKIEAEKLIAKVNKLAEKYESLKLGPFSQKIFELIMNDGPSKIKEAYLKSIIGDSNSPSLKNLLSQDADLIFKEMQVFIDDVKKYHPGASYSYHNFMTGMNSIQLGTFKDARFILTDQDIESIKDQKCRTYITTKEQLDAVEHLKTFIESFNKLSAAINKFNPAIHRLFTDSFQNVGRYATIENGVATLRTEDIVEVIGN